MHWFSARVPHRELIQALASVLIMADQSFQMGVILFLIEKRNQGLESRFHVADYPEVQPRATSKVLTAAVNLNDRCLLRIKLGVRKIRTEHEQRVGLHNG